MKLALILSSTQAEKNWNALRLANLAIKKGDDVSIFLLGEGVEYDKFSSEKFNIKSQVGAFLKSEKASILACGTCMKLRQQEGTDTCPVGGLEDLYTLIEENDKLISF